MLAGVGGDLDHLLARIVGVDIDRRACRGKQLGLPCRGRAAARDDGALAGRAQRTPAGARAPPCAAGALQTACACSCTILFSSGRQEPQLVPARSALPIASTLRGAVRRDGVADDVEPDAEAGADHRAGFGQTVSRARPTAACGAAMSASASASNSGLDGVPLRRGVGRAEEQRSRRAGRRGTRPRDRCRAAGR